MPITLSSSDLDQVARAIHLLVTPLDFATVDEWRSAVNRQLKELLHADSVGFFLPVEDGLMLYSEEHDPEELARYQDYPPPPMIDGTPMWEAMVRNGVMTLAQGYGERYELYTNSVYYNEYSGANGAHDTMSMGFALGEEVDPGNMSILHFWHGSPHGRLFGERETQLLRLLLPAFHAGVESQTRWGEQRRELLDTLDRLGEAVLLTDLGGRLLHVSPALEQVIAEDAEPERLRHELWRVIHDVRTAAIGKPISAAAPASPARDLTTATGRYRVRACLYGRRFRGHACYVVLGLERRSPVPLTPDELSATYSLTPAEIRVALLLGQGSSNREIATELFITDHTARRHTERILSKMNVRSRAEVVAKLFG